MAWSASLLRTVLNIQPIWTMYLLLVCGLLLPMAPLLLMHGPAPALH